MLALLLACATSTTTSTATLPLAATGDTAATAAPTADTGPIGTERGCEAAVGEGSCGVISAELPNLALCRDGYEYGDVVGLQGTFSGWTFTATDGTVIELVADGTWPGFAGPSALGEVLLDVTGSCGSKDGHVRAAVAVRRLDGSLVFAVGNGVGDWSVGGFTVTRLDPTCPSIPGGCTACARARSLAFAGPAAAELGSGEVAEVDGYTFTVATAYVEEGIEWSCSDSPGEHASWRIEGPG